MSRPCECHTCTASHNSKLMSTSSATTVATEKLDLTSHSPASYLFYPNITNHQPLDLSHHGITAKHPLIHPHLYNLTSQKPTKLSNHTQPTSFQPGGLESPSSDTVLRDHLAAHTYLYGDWNHAYENAKMILHSRGYGHDTDPDLLQSVRAALQSNCKGGGDKGVPPPPTSQGEKDVHCKQHSAKPHKESKKQKQGHVCTEACANTALLPPDGWGPAGKEQLLAQFQQQQQVLPPPPLSAESPKKNGVTTSRADSTISAEMCAKRNLPVVKSQAQPQVSSMSSSSKAPSVTQQQQSSSQCTQVAAGHFGNVPVASSQASSHHSLSSAAATSLGSGSLAGGDVSASKPPSSNKKKRPAPDNEDLPPGTEAHMGLQHTGKVMV